MLNFSHLIITTRMSTGWGPKGTFVHLNDIYANNARNITKRDLKLTRRMLDIKVQAAINPLNASLKTIERLMKEQNRGRYTKLEAQFIAAEFGHGSWSILEKVEYDRDRFFAALSDQSAVDAILTDYALQYIGGKAVIEQIFTYFWRKASTGMYDAAYYTEDQVYAYYIDRPEVLMSIGLGAEDLIRIKQVASDFVKIEADRTALEKNPFGIKPPPDKAAPSTTPLRVADLPIATVFANEVAQAARRATNWVDITNEAVRVVEPLPGEGPATRAMRELREAGERDRAQIPEIVAGVEPITREGVVNLARILNEPEHFPAEETRPDPTPVDPQTNEPIDPTEA